MSSFARLPETRGVLVDPSDAGVAMATSPTDTSDDDMWRFDLSKSRVAVATPGSDKSRVILAGSDTLRCTGPLGELGGPR